MKTQLAGITLFAATVSAVALYPALESDARTNNQVIVDPLSTHQSTTPTQAEKPRIEVVFALDTTSSMSGFIAAAKEKIWSIATTLASAQPAPEIHIGLVAFRDRGDQYITRVTDLSADLDSVYAQLMDYKAAGGGDGPESVNKALYDAVKKISWSQKDNTYRVIFLVGDAPPHRDYAEMQYPEIIKMANARGIRVNAIQSGQNPSTAQVWQQIAQLAQGEFFNVAEGGSAVAVATPFDRELATLSRALEDTRLYFGDAEAKAKQQRKKAATDKVHAGASESSRARRAAFNASSSGERNFLGENELVSAVVAGDVDLDAVKKEYLPSSLQALAPEARKNVVMRQAKKRDELAGRIKELADRRDAYIADEIEAEGGALDSLDHKLYETVKAQTAATGLEYKAAPKY